MPAALFSSIELLRLPTEMPGGALPPTKKLNLEPFWNLESTNKEFRIQ